MAASGAIPAQACYTEPDQTSYNDNFGIRYSVPIDKAENAKLVTDVPDAALHQVLKLNTKEAKSLELKPEWFAMLGDYFFNRSKKIGSFHAAAQLYNRAAQLELQQTTPSKSKADAYLEKAKESAQADELSTRHTQRTSAVQSPNIHSRPIFLPAIH